MFSRAIHRIGVVSLLIPAALLLLPLYLYPLVQIVSRSFGGQGWSIANYLELFSDPVILRVLYHTFRFALIIALLCLLLGYPLAYAMRIVSDRTRRTVTLLILLPLWTSSLVRGFAWIVILGRNGIVNTALTDLGIIDEPLKLVYNKMGVYVGMVHIMLPFMVLSLYSTLSRMDLRLLSAAESLGSRPISAFFWIVLPLSMPGVLAGALLVFMSSVGMFVIPALLGGLSDITYIMLIEKQINELNNWGLAAAMSVLLIVTTGVLTALYERTLNIETSAGILGQVVRHVFQRGPIHLLVWRERLLAKLFPMHASQLATGKQSAHLGSRHLFVKCCSWWVLVWLVAPLAVLFPLAFSGAAYLHFPPQSYSIRWFENFFSRDDWITPTITSLKVAILATIGVIVIGAPAAYAIVRGRFPGKGIITVILISPMIVPVLIFAISLYAIYVRFNLLGTVGGLVLAHIILALPYVLVTVSAGLKSTDESLEAAALTMGASPVRAFWFVTLPVLRPAVISAAFLAFLASFDDVILALFLSGTSAKTLPVRMWEGIRYEIDPTIAAVSVMLILIAIGLKFAAERPVKRGAKSNIAEYCGRANR
ncbi:putative spermidine/putrescine transport system permease protein [Bradyrhizobium macuxiense]|uniref:Putative spermidine/putrescine transport system permease protein n=1 Tax=Bradyrhizobium macuxiense TaxID=1755647 RepID=A0A560KYS5_9BRAD|nr:ABC transporter permease subunit [Bradyrhizobium macuxiense]TWB86010.1 putative spermidine/putrescine transport system permease protein [Bradyrhizobium macuxiense]